MSGRAPVNLAPPTSLAELQRSLRDLAAHVNRLVEAGCEEHGPEGHHGARSPERRRSEQVLRLLSGGPFEPSELGYELDAWHLGAVASGPEARAALRSLAKALDRRLLLVRGEPDLAWAWLGGARPPSSRRASEAAAERRPEGVCLALGEPGEGPDGWRLTHRQARAAFPIARRRAEGPVRYADVALLAAALQDDLLATSLRRLYLEPLAVGRDSGARLRETLRAYFAAGLNVSSTAAALEVTRRTVRNRLYAVEELLGCPLGAVDAQLDLALDLEELEKPSRGTEAL